MSMKSAGATPTDAMGNNDSAQELSKPTITPGAAEGGSKTDKEQQHQDDENGGARDGDVLPWFLIARCRCCRNDERRRCCKFQAKEDRTKYRLVISW